MKSVLTILFLLFVDCSLAQRQFIDFSYGDKTVLRPGFSESDSLAKKLTASSTTDIQKLTSIFRWITENIAYRTKPNTGFKKAGRYAVEILDDSLDFSTSLNERIALDVLRKKQAVCDGYARLLKVLCESVGLNCEIITGYARTNINRVGDQFKSNHRWNAVLLDGSWYLMDVTWASGYINSGTEQFVKAYDRRYFMALPKDFIQDHYPEDSRWTLLGNPPTLAEFYRTPFKHSAFAKYSIVSFAPAKGVIEASIGDTVSVELTLASIGQKEIAPDTIKPDSEILPRAHATDMLTPLENSDRRKINYRYAITSQNIGWLNVIYNDDVVLRYKLNVRRKNDE